MPDSLCSLQLVLTNLKLGYMYAVCSCEQQVKVGYFISNLVYMRCRHFFHSFHLKYNIKKYDVFYILVCMYACLYVCQALRERIMMEEVQVREETAALLLW